MAVLSSTLTSMAQQILPAELYQRLQQDSSVETFRITTDWLQQRIAAVRQFIPNTVVRHYVKHHAEHMPLGEFRTGTLLFADVSGFTSLSEHLAVLGREGSEEITRVINQLFAALTAEIEYFGGDLIKFSGDALTAIFDSHLLGAEHPSYALGAAMRMQQQMQALGQVQTRLGVFQLRMRIGVHTGTAFMATVGDDQHRELMLVGSDVNLVAQAQESAEPGNIVISYQTYATLKEQQLQVHPLDDLFLRVQSYTIPSSPTLTELELTADTNDPQELSRLLNLYSSLSCYLPANLTPHQLLDSDQLTTGGLRLVVALFAQVTNLSAIIQTYRHQPNHIRPVINQYYTAMQHIVMHYGGIVNKVDLATDGDKLLAIFGAPIAHENDADLALRAALAMQEAINYVNAEIQLIDSKLPLLDQRIGVNQGHVFAGLVGGMNRREYTIMGDSVNIAARLMSRSAFGDILVGPLIRQNCHTGFEFEVMEPMALKGKREPIEPARIRRMYHVRRDIERAPLVGRAQELAQIQQCAAHALQGNGQAMLISGEAGIGKTRLAEEGLQWLTIQSFDSSYDIPVFVPITIECQFYEQGTPYASINTLLRQLLRISPSTALDKIMQRIQALAPLLSHLAPLLSDVFNIPVEETSLTRSLTPEQRHDRTLDLIEALIIATTQQSPIVLVWDDIHWLDASSREVLDRIITSCHTIPLFIVLLSRNVVDPSSNELPWPNVQYIQLQELSNEDRLALVKAMLNSEVPEHLIERWNTPNDHFFNPQGNPFFIEELIRALVDHHILIRTEHGWELHGNLDSLPSTIEGMLTARLDQLEASHRETIQVAAVVGRRFQIRILEQLLNTNDLPDHLEHIAAADLVQQDQMAAELAYLFKHTMIRDVAYETILYARRRELHRRVAQEIEMLYADHLEEMYGLLSNHYLQAEDWERALYFLTLAGKRAQQSYANQEAIEYYQTAIGLFPHFDTLPEFVYIDVHEQLGLVLTQTGDYEQALAILELARAVAQKHSLYEQQARMMRHMAVIYERKAEYGEAINIINQALVLLHTYSPHSDEISRLFIAAAALEQRQGNNRSAIEWAEKSLKHADNHSAIPEDYAEIFLIIGGSYRLLGDSQKAVQFLQKSLDIYIEIDNVSRIADTYVNLANTYTDLKEYSISVDYFMKANHIKHLVNDQYGQALALMNLGDTYVKLNQYDNAIEVLEDSIVIWHKLSYDLALAISYMNLGNAYLNRQEYDKSRLLLDKSKDIFTRIQVKSFFSELYRIYAELYLAELQPDKALEYTNVSFNVAQELEATLDMAHTLILKGRIYVSLEDITTALSLIQQAKELYMECGSHHDILICEEIVSTLIERS